MDAADNFGLFINILTFIDLVLWLLGYVRLREQIKELEEALNDVTDELDKALGMGFSTDNLQVRFHKYVSGLNSAFHVTLVLHCRTKLNIFFLRPCSTGRLREETSVLFREVDFEKTLYGEAWSILLGMNWEIFRLTKELKLLLLAVMVCCCSLSLPPRFVSSFTRRTVFCYEPISDSYTLAS